MNKKGQDSARQTFFRAAWFVLVLIVIILIIIAVRKGLFIQLANIF